MPESPNGKPLTEEQVSRRIRQLAEQAWNHSRPHPQEATFDQMTEIFQRRMMDYTHVLIIKLVQEGMV